MKPQVAICTRCWNTDARKPPGWYLCTPCKVSSPLAIARRIRARPERVQIKR